VDWMKKELKEKQGTGSARSAKCRFSSASRCQHTDGFKNIRDKRRESALHWRNTSSNP
ncbi:hypothetical protein HAX54_017887, partial [Datura stramonium]|nr:hypothetical protein [Datura stramonium]